MKRLLAIVLSLSIVTIASAQGSALRFYDINGFLFGSTDDFETNDPYLLPGIGAYDYTEGIFYVAPYGGPWSDSADVWEDPTPQISMEMLMILRLAQRDTMLLQSIQAISLTPGPQGAQGPKGDTGDTGPSGIIAVNTPIVNSGSSTSANLSISAATTSAAGSMSAADKTKLDRIQAVRGTTNGSGSYTWTFTTPYPSGVTPVVQTNIEDTSGGSVMYNPKITAISNTSVTVNVSRSQAVTILGISVLGVQAASATTIHLTAIAP